MENVHIVVYIQIPFLASNVNLPVRQAFKDGVLHLSFRRQFVGCYLAEWKELQNFLALFTPSPL